MFLGFDFKLTEMKGSGFQRNGGGEAEMTEVISE